LRKDQKIAFLIRKTKGAVKLHVKFNHAGYIPSFALLTTDSVHESQIASEIPLDSGDLVVMDRGYLDFGYLQTLENNGVFFVTRLKSNSRFRVIERRAHPQANICADQIIALTGFYTHQNYDDILFLVESEKSGSPVA
jgi:hypothetical protein